MLLLVRTMDSDTEDGRGAFDVFEEDEGEQQVDDSDAVDLVCGAASILVPVDEEIVSAYLKYHFWSNVDVEEKV